EPAPVPPMPSPPASSGAGPPHAVASARNVRVTPAASGAFLKSIGHSLADAGPARSSHSDHPATPFASCGSTPLPLPVCALSARAGPASRRVDPLGRREGGHKGPPHLRLHTKPYLRSDRTSSAAAPDWPLRRRVARRAPRGRTQP